MAVEGAEDEVQLAVGAAHACATPKQRRRELRGRELHGEHRREDAPARAQREPGSTRAGPQLSTGRALKDMHHARRRRHDHLHRTIVAQRDDRHTLHAQRRGLHLPQRAAVMPPCGHRACGVHGNELERSISIDVRGDDLALDLVHLNREAVTQAAVRRRENVEEAHGRSHSHLECAVAVKIRHAYRCVDVCERAMGSIRGGA